MQQEHLIIKQVTAAKASMKDADDLIRQYLPFIKSEATKFLQRPCTDQDDELSVAMIAFHEAIGGYSKERGAFMKYAALLIRSRLIDFQRKEKRHFGHVSLDAAQNEDDKTLEEKMADDVNDYERREGLFATKREIEELSKIMAEYKISLTDVAENSPKQASTREACGRAVRYAIENPEILEELLKTKKLPLASLADGSGAVRKTLERHRKYIIALLLIQTNGYEIIRGHLKHALSKRGGRTI